MRLVAAIKNVSAIVAPKKNVKAIAITKPDNVTPENVPVELAVRVLAAGVVAAGVPVAAGGILKKIRVAVKVVLDFFLHWLKRFENDLSHLAELLIAIANSWLTLSKFSKETVVILLAIIKYFYGSSGME